MLKLLHSNDSGRKKRDYQQIGAECCDGHLCNGYMPMKIGNQVTMILLSSNYTCLEKHTSLNSKLAIRYLIFSFISKDAYLNKLCRSFKWTTLSFSYVNDTLSFYWQYNKLKIAELNLFIIYLYWDLCLFYSLQWLSRHFNIFIKAVCIVFNPISSAMLT